MMNSMIRLYLHRKGINNGSNSNLPSEFTPSKETVAYHLK